MLLTINTAIVTTGVIVFLIVTLILVAVLDEIHQNFRVRVGIENIALRRKLVLDLKVVLDDAIVHNGQLSRIAHVGMGIAHAGFPVRCPAGVSHAGGGSRRRFGAQKPFQGIELALCLHHAELALLYAGDASGIVASVLKPVQFFDNKGHCRSVSGIADYSTHCFVSSISLQFLSGEFPKSLSCSFCSLFFEDFCQGKIWMRMQSRAWACT